MELRKIMLWLFVQLDRMEIYPSWKENNKDVAGYNIAGILTASEGTQLY